MDRALPPPLTGLTPGTLREGAGFPGVEAALVSAVRAAARAGLKGLMLREPHLEDASLLCIARSIRAVFDGWLCIHDRVHLVGCVGAQGAHITDRSLAPQAAREVLGPGVCLSASTHAGCDAPDSSCVDLALHAPVFKPHSKMSGGNELGREGLIEAVRRFDVPVVALGGVDPRRVASLKQSGIVGCAAIGAIWGTDATPIDGLRRSALLDIEGIEERTGALVDATAACIETGEAR